MQLKTTFPFLMSLLIAQPLFAHNPKDAKSKPAAPRPRDEFDGPDEYLPRHAPPDQLAVSVVSSLMTPFREFCAKRGVTLSTHQVNFALDVFMAVHTRRAMMQELGGTSPRGYLTWMLIPGETRAEIDVIFNLALEFLGLQDKASVIDKSEIATKKPEDIIDRMNQEQKYIMVIPNLSQQLVTEAQQLGISDSQPNIPGSHFLTWLLTTGVAGGHFFILDTDGLALAFTEPEFQEKLYDNQALGGDATLYMMCDHYLNPQVTNATVKN